MADQLERLPRAADLWTAVGLAASVLCVLTALTIKQVRYWVDSESLLTHALEATTDNALVHSTLGGLLAARAETRPEAIQQYREALRIMPQLSDAHWGLAVALAAEGHMDEAIKQCAESLRLDPNDSRAHNTLGKFLAMRGAKEAALNQFRTAVKLDPLNAEAYCNLGLALFETGRSPAAIDAFRTAVRLKPALARRISTWPEPLRLPAQRQKQSPSSGRRRRWRRRGATPNWPRRV